MLARQRLTIQLTKKALDFLCDAGYDPQFGARPMKRALQDHLIDDLSTELLRGTFAAGDTVYVDAKGDELVFSNKKNKDAKTVAEWRSASSKTKAPTRRQKTPPQPWQKQTGKAI